MYTLLPGAGRDALFSLWSEMMRMMTGAVLENMVKPFLWWAAGSWETRGQELVSPLPGGYVKDMVSILESSETRAEFDLILK